MALFTLQELIDKTSGHLSTVSQGEYDRAHAFAEAYILAHTKIKYIDSVDPTEKVRKVLALEIGFCHVIWEHFNEQSEIGMQATQRFNRAVEALKAIASGDLSADAAYDEFSERKAVSSNSYTSSGEQASPVFTVDKMEIW